MSINRFSKFVSLMIIITILTASCSSGKSYINTSVGEITVMRFEIVDELFGGFKPDKPGLVILLISFESKDGGRIDGFDEASKNVFLTNSSGDRYEIDVVGWEYQEDYLGFAIPEQESVLMLNWPGNDPIPIEIQGQ